MSSLPDISVVLPVYNAEAFLKEAMDSLLSQSFRNFEVIVINDGSTDNSGEIAKGYSDDRIRYYEQENSGLAATLNRGVDLARAAFIARMDNDDVCDADRLRLQFRFMQEHPETVLLGTMAGIIDEHSRPAGRYLDHPVSQAALRMAILFNNPFVHSSVMFRKETFSLTGGYSRDQRYFEDYHLWSQMAAIGRIDNLPQRLILYREVSTSMSRSTADYSRRVTNQSVLNISRLCPQFSHDEIELFTSALNGFESEEGYRKALAIVKPMLAEIVQALVARERFDRRELASESAKYLFSFRRHYYNSIIESGTATAAEKGIARLRRKLLFMTRQSA